MVLYFCLFSYHKGDGIGDARAAGHNDSGEGGIGAVGGSSIDALKFDGDVIFLRLTLTKPSKIGSRGTVDKLDDAYGLSPKDFRVVVCNPLSLRAYPIAPRAYPLPCPENRSKGTKRIKLMIVRILIQLTQMTVKVIQVSLNLERIIKERVHNEDKDRVLN